MSEKIPSSSEAPRPSGEHHGHSSEQLSHSPDKHNHHHESERSQTAENLAHLRQEVAREARSSQEVAPQHHASAEKQQPQGPIKRELQEMMRIRTLNRIRKDLPTGQRALSKIVHAKPVAAVSAVGEKTIARPYGLLGGGLVALLGSLYTFYTAKHYGFRYNFIVFFILFVAGYLTATLLEVTYKLYKRSR